jgi:type II secretory pathway component GspD/PulD (secretin)
MVALCAACSAPAGADAGMQVRIVRLEHADANDVGLALGQSTITRVAGEVPFKFVVQPEHNALVLSGTDAQLQQAMALVARLDVRKGS